MMNKLYFLIAIFLWLSTCKDAPKTNLQSKASNRRAYKKIKGITMGVVPYQITYRGTQNQILQPRIDSVLVALNKGASHYEKTSTITQFNQSEKGIITENNGYDHHFVNNLLVAKEIVKKTDGYFDPTVAPLVNYYGFGTKGKEGVAAIDTTKVLNLMQFVGFDKLTITKSKDKYLINKSTSKLQLDFSAIAKGYAIDKVGQFLEKNNIHDYLIDIGGESLAKGKNAKGNWWRVAIQDPKAPRGYYNQEYIPILETRSMATSGNYENFRIIKGQKMGHTMNPKTGFPELNNMLSATVFAKDCIIADSYATAFMAMGMEKAFNLAQKLPEIDAYLLYLDKNGEMVSKYTQGVKGIINEK